MSHYTFSHDELYETLEKYTKLKWNTEGYLYGTIDIHHKYGDFVVRDSFSVLIGANEKYPKVPPMLLENGGRTKQIANKYKITNYQDLHCNKRDVSSTACLCAKQEYPKRFPHGSDLVVFMDDLVIPYLYALSYYDTHGEWPSWGERSHGLFGLLEAHGDIENVTKEEVMELVSLLRSLTNWTFYHKQIKKPNPNRPCPCSKRKSFEKCHTEAWKGLMKLRDDIQRLNLNAKNIFNITIDK